LPSELHCRQLSAQQFSLTYGIEQALIIDLQGWRDDLLKTLHAAQGLMENPALFMWTHQLQLREKRAEDNGKKEKRVITKRKKNIAKLIAD